MLAGEEYQQISGLAMGSHLRAALSYLFIDTLERDHCRDIIGKHSTWLRHVDAENIFIRSDLSLSSIFPILPSSNTSQVISKYFDSAVKIASTSGEKIHDILRDKRQPGNNPSSAAYRIPCRRCEKVYFGETGRGFSTRISERRADPSPQDFQCHGASLR